MSAGRRYRWITAAAAGLVLGVVLIVVFHVPPGQPTGPTPGTFRPTVTSPLPSDGTLPAHCHYQPQNLPDRACNPGEPNPAVTQDNLAATICSTTKVGGKTWTQRQRPPSSYTNAVKRKQMAAYGATGPLSADEEDHIFPLEVGGNPTDQRNLYPEPWAGPYGAHTKDQIENAVHRAVCRGRLTLAQGQAVFEGDWWRYSG